MSKKKNTLKDLDEFLKQQAATLVAPQKLSEAMRQETPAPAIQPAATPTPAPNIPAATTTEPVSTETILRNLRQLSDTDTAFRQALYDLIMRSLESLPTSLPEDKMLINTALYLKNGEQWKEAIRQYWKGSPGSDH